MSDELTKNLSKESILICEKTAELLKSDFINGLTKNQLERVFDRVLDSVDFNKYIKINNSSDNVIQEIENHLKDAKLLKDDMKF